MEKSNSNQNGLSIGGIQAFIVTGYDAESPNVVKHTTEYKVHQLRKPIKGKGRIAYKEGEVFAVCFGSNFVGKFAAAIYVDGVNVVQDKGIISLAEIEDNQNIVNHPHFINPIDFVGDVSYVGNLSQLNGANRRLVFTKEELGINYNLIGDKSLANQISIFLWNIKPIEKPIEKPKLKVKSRSIGAGAATNKKYDTDDTEYDYQYVGKLVFVTEAAEENPDLSPRFYHQPAVADPMDAVPMAGK